MNLNKLDVLRPGEMPLAKGAAAAAPLPPLDRASLALIENTFAKAGASVKVTKAAVIKEIEGLPMEGRAAALMRFAMLNGTTYT